MNTLLLERAQSFVHLAHPTSSYPGTSAWALILNCKSDNWKKCFHMFPLKPGAHIGVDVFLFPDMTAPGQARGFGQWKSRADVLPHHHASITSTLVHGTQFLSCVQLVFWVSLVLVCFNSCKLGLNSKDPAPLLSHPSTFYNENPNTFFPNYSHPNVQTRNSSYTNTPFNLTVTL